MTLRKDSTRAGLEILLEMHGDSFIAELDRNHDRPRTVMNGVAKRAVVMPFEPILKGARSADVMASWVHRTADDVDDSLLDPIHPINKRMQWAVKNSPRFATRHSRVRSYCDR